MLFDRHQLAANDCADPLFNDPKRSMQFLKSKPLLLHKMGTRIGKVLIPRKMKGNSVLSLTEADCGTLLRLA